MPLTGVYPFPSFLLSLSLSFYSLVVLVIILSSHKNAEKKRQVHFNYELNIWPPYIVLLLCCLTVLSFSLKMI